MSGRLTRAVLASWATYFVFHCLLLFLHFLTPIGWPRAGDDTRFLGAILSILHVFDAPAVAIARLTSMSALASPNMGGILWSPLVNTLLIAILVAPLMLIRNKPRAGDG